MACATPRVGAVCECPVAAAPANGRSDSCAVLAAVEPFDFPDVRFHAGILQFVHGLGHQAGAQLDVERLTVHLGELVIRLGRFSVSSTGLWAFAVLNATGARGGSRRLLTIRNNLKKTHCGNLLPP